MRLLKADIKYTKRAIEFAIRRREIGWLFLYFIGIISRPLSYLLLYAVILPVSGIILSITCKMNFSDVIDEIYIGTCKNYEIGAEDDFHWMSL